MGYRQPDAELDNNKWAKPIGYNIFIAHEKELRLNVHYRVNGNDQLHCWESAIMNTDTNLTSQIAAVEEYTTSRGIHQNGQNFAFTSKIQEAEQVCNFLKQ